MENAYPLPAIFVGRAIADVSEPKGKGQASQATGTTQYFWDKPLFNATYGR